jgi:hypothetical protein
MSAKSAEVVADHQTLIDDIILHEDDLSEEAKSQFDYHTKILDIFKQHRSHVLKNDKIAPIGRHLILSRLAKTYNDFKRVLNYAAANRELLSDSLPSFGPLIICGLPRTGSTLLYNLLACDPNCRAPGFIDMFIECVPPISRSDIIERERRMLLAKQYAEMRNQLVGHPVKHAASHPTLPIEEDFLILEHAGIHLIMPVTTPLDQSEPSKLIYDKTNKDSAYAYHETFLRMLGTVDKPSSHWLLKSPFHNFNFDTLLRQYPNAALIMTHRCLEDVVPSFCRLLDTFDYFFDETNSTGKEILRARALERIDKTVECILEFRSGQTDQYDQARKTICDVFYDDLMKDPITIVKQIYDHFGLRWSEQFEMAMHAWLRDNPQGHQGRNTYSLSDYGLTQEYINTRYAAYIDLFLRPPCSSQSSSTSAQS